MNQAVIPALTRQRNSILLDLSIVAMGVLLISGLAQIAIPIPGSPVPITGQTFGVTLMALNFGRRLALATIMTYLAAGAIGLPVFALGKSGFSLGPTTGYLIGMCVAVGIIGFLADKGFTKSFPRAWFAGACGSFCIFSFGLGWLSFFVPPEHLLSQGLLPFIPGDIIKTITAAYLSTRAQRLIK